MPLPATLLPAALLPAAPLPATPLPTTSLLADACRYGHFHVAERLQPLCNVSTANPKVQDAAWYGHVIVAAKGGHQEVRQAKPPHTHTWQPRGARPAALAPTSHALVCAP